MDAETDEGCDAEEDDGATAPFGADSLNGGASEGAHLSSRSHIETDNGA